MLVGSLGGLLSLSVVLFDVDSGGVVVDFPLLPILVAASVFGQDLGPMVSGDQCWNDVFMLLALSMAAFASLSL